MNKTLRLFTLLAIALLTSGFASAQSGNITFADPAVKAICVTNWDTDGDGELSYDEAAAVTSIGNMIFWFKSITSFDELQYFTGLTSIDSYAFENCSHLMSITIPEGVTNIDEGAFANCSGLTSVTIPESVTSIGIGAFMYCTGLTSVTLPESVTSIGSWAFLGCSALTSIVILESVISIGEGAYQGCTELTSISVASGNTVYDSREECNAIIETSTNMLIFGCQNTVIPNSVTGIGDYAFDGCPDLTNVTIPEGVTSIGNHAFAYCSGLTSVTFPESLTDIGDYAFRNCCSLTSIIIPASVTVISNYAFDQCTGLTSVTLPESVTRIGYYAFFDCSSLTSITIPSSVTGIDSYAFADCTSLTEVTSLIKEPFEISSDVFSNWNNETSEEFFTSATLYVPVGTKEKYEATPAWNLFMNIVEMGIEPMNQGETVDFGTDFDADTNLDGNVVGDIYYSISGGNGAYNAAEGCIVVTTPTDDDSVSGLSGTDIFGEDFNDHFTGIVFKVAPGKGTIKIEAQTTGGMVLKVKIGDNEPVTMELEGKLKVSFPYNVSEDTYVYIYAGANAAQANSARAASADGALKIYGIEVESVVDGLDTVQTDDDQDAPVYNLNGQRVNTPAKGVYIKGGKKVLVK